MSLRKFAYKKQVLEIGHFKKKRETVESSWNRSASKLEMWSSWEQVKSVSI